MRSLLLVCAFVLASTQAYATITINKITGVSNFTITGNTTAGTGGTTTPAAGTSNATVWGGIAGYDATTGTNPSCAAATMNNVDPCDSCPAAVCEDGAATALAPLCACNRARIYNNLKVSIAVTQSQSPNYNVRAVASSTTAGSTSGELNITDIGTGAVTFTWGEVCRVMSGAADCEAIVTQGAQTTVSVYLDKDGNNQYTSGEEKVDVTFRIVNPGRTDYNVFGDGASEGIGDFTPWPGDDRAYLKDVNTTTNFPSLAYGVNISSVKVFLSKTGLDKANPKDKDIEGNLDVDGTGGVGQNFVDGVENGQLYFMRLAMQDQAGNVIAFFPDLNATDAKTLQHAGDCNTTGAPGPSKACPFSVIPDQVLGLLSKDFNCFIASAAYGTSLEPKLDLFRRFRSDVLLRYAWGRSFVWKYYAYGPYAARYISDKPVLRAMVRGLLWPLAGYSWLALKIGLVKSLILSLALLIAAMGLPWIATRRRAGRA